MRKNYRVAWSYIGALICAFIFIFFAFIEQMHFKALALDIVPVSLVSPPGITLVPTGFISPPIQIIQAPSPTPTPTFTPTPTKSPPILSTPIPTQTPQPTSIPTPTPTINLTPVYYWLSFGPQNTPDTSWDTAEELLDLIATAGFTPVEIDRYINGGWDSHVKDLPFNNFSLHEGEGYFIKFSTNPNANPFALLPYPSSTKPDAINYSVSAGWNYFSIPQNLMNWGAFNQLTAEDICISITYQGGVAQEIVNVLDQIESNAWTHYACGGINNNFNIDAGRGYFIKSQIYSFWALPYVESTPTPTPTSTPTSTPIPTVTTTPTVTPSSSPTPTVTISPTVTPSLTPTATLTPTPKPTITPTPTKKPTATPTRKPTVTPTKKLTPTITLSPTPAVKTITLQVAASTDDVNQDGQTLDKTYGPTYRYVWLGTGSDTKSSFTGLRFQKVAIPKGAKISSAKLEVYTDSNSWISMQFQIAGENVGNSLTFSKSNKPSDRNLTGTKVNHSSDSKWNANKWYLLNDIPSIIQEIVNRSDWNSGNSLSLILKGTGSRWGRKFVTSFDGKSKYAPRLTITYQMP